MSAEWYDAADELQDRLIELDNLAQRNKSLRDLLQFILNDQRSNLHYLTIERIQDTLIEKE